MRLSINLTVSLERDQGEIAERETDVYTAADFATTPDIPTAMQPVGFVPDDHEWEGKR